MPTASLYLQDALSEDRQIRWTQLRAGTHSFRLGDSLIMVRYGSVKALKQSTRRLIYVVDDDLTAIREDASLPAGYRETISRFVEGPWEEIVAAADEIVVPSSPLESTYRSFGKKVQRLDPYWGGLNPGPRPGNSGLKIAWLATRSHLRDFETISNQLIAYFEQHPDSTLTVLSGSFLNEELKGYPWLRNLKPLSWPRYRTWLASERFDLAIHPLLDTVVNRARSLSKWLEITATGALPLISRIHPWTEFLGQESEFLVDDDDWEATLSRLDADSVQMKHLRDRALGIATDLNQTSKEQQITYWSTKLNL